MKIESMAILTLNASDYIKNSFEMIQNSREGTKVPIRVESCLSRVNQGWRRHIGCNIGKVRYESWVRAGVLLDYAHGFGMRRWVRSSVCVGWRQNESRGLTRATFARVEVVVYAAEHSSLM